MNRTIAAETILHIGRVSNLCTQKGKQQWQEGKKVSMWNKLFKWQWNRNV